MSGWIVGRFAGSRSNGVSVPNMKHNYKSIKDRRKKKWKENPPEERSAFSFPSFGPAYFFFRPPVVQFFVSQQQIYKIPPQHGRQASGILWLGAHELVIDWPVIFLGLVSQFPVGERFSPLSVSGPLLFDFLLQGPEICSLDRGEKTHRAGSFSVSFLWKGKRTCATWKSTWEMGLKRFFIRIRKVVLFFPSEDL